MSQKEYIAERNDKRYKPSDGSTPLQREARRNHIIGDVVCVVLLVTVAFALFYPALRALT